MRAWSCLAAVAFGLNAAWELLQLPLYAGDPGVLVCLLAALDDALIIVVVVVAATVIGRRWPGAFWPLLVGALAATAAVIEVRAITGGRWAYSDAMPTLGPLGLSPLVQLPMLGTLATLAARRVGARRSGPGAHPPGGRAA